MKDTDFFVIIGIVIIVVVGAIVITTGKSNHKNCQICGHYKATDTKYTGDGFDRYIECDNEHIILINTFEETTQTKDKWNIYREEIKEEEQKLLCNCKPNKYTQEGLSCYG